MSLQQYERNVHSQNGEDGIVEELCSRLNISSGYFVEFGAWDGKIYSNAYNLLDNHGWTGCYIEADPEKFAVLNRNIPDARIAKVCAFVAPSGDFTLDRILVRAGAPKDFDLLSIDIDSDDYAVWAAFTEFQPKIVIVEYNQTIPNSCFYVQPLGESKGNSARALTELGAEKGYQLVAVTHTNLIFLLEDLAAAAGIVPMPLEQLRDDVGYIFHGYDGEIIVTGHMHVNPWSHMPIIQPLPKFLRGFQPRPKLIGKVRKQYRKLITFLLT